MLFPGCRIKVIESTAKGSTGPIPGSVGFISNFKGQQTYVDCQRIVWYRYGNKGKERIETGRFHIFLQDGLPLKNITKARYGKVEISGSKNWDNMNTMEFLCWAFSILRLPKSIELQQQMANDLKQMFGIKIHHKMHGFRAAHLFHGGADFENFGSRYMMFKYCRKAREIYYRNKIRTIKQSMDVLHNHIQQDIKTALKKQKIDHSPASFAEAVATQSLPGPNYRYTSFVSNFSGDAILFPRADQICKGNVWISAVVDRLTK